MKSKNPIMAILGTLIILNCVACATPKEAIQTVVPTLIPTQVYTLVPSDNPAPVFQVSYEIHSDVISKPGTSNIWSIIWGKNGNDFSYEYKNTDLSNVKSLGQGLYINWFETFEGESGDSLMLSIYGGYGAKCAIIIDEVEVASSIMEVADYSEWERTTCRYVIP